MEVSEHAGAGALSHLACDGGGGSGGGGDSFGLGSFFVDDGAVGGDRSLLEGGGRVALETTILGAFPDLVVSNNLCGIVLAVGVEVKMQDAEAAAEETENEVGNDGKVVKLPSKDDVADGEHHANEEHDSTKDSHSVVDPSEMSHAQRERPEEEESVADGMSVPVLAGVDAPVGVASNHHHREGDKMVELLVGHEHGDSGHGRVVISLDRLVDEAERRVHGETEAEPDEQVPHLSHGVEIGWTDGNHFSKLNRE